MKCRHCGSSDTRVITTDHFPFGTKRYCRCLACDKRYRTFEHYDPKPRLSKSYIGTAREPSIARGERHGSAVLTADNVREIRRRADDGETYRSLAQVFGISRQHIADIHRRKSWKHVDAERTPLTDLRDEFTSLRRQLEEAGRHPAFIDEELSVRLLAAVQSLHSICRSL